MSQKKTQNSKQKQERVKLDKLDPAVKELGEAEAKRVKGGLIGTFTNAQPNKPKPAIGTFT